MKRRAAVAICTPKQLPERLQVAAAKIAVAENPANAPVSELAPLMSVALTGTTEAVALGVLTPLRLAFITGRYWGAGGVDLTVSFLDNPTAGFRSKWLAHANAWSEVAGGNVRFRWVQSGGQVRVSRGRGGYWSYLGTDIQSVPRNQQTMNLEGFTERTPEAEWTRVVRHEVGHTLGCPHEHLRRAIVAKIDPQKAIDYFRRTQGWDERTTRANVLTPIEESSLLGTEVTDETSIMAYQLPGAITRDGRPIVGGSDFSGTDKAFVPRVYPKAAPPEPPDPPVGGGVAYIETLDKDQKPIKRYKLVEV